jgi:hypothetical protein
MLPDWFQRNNQLEQMQSGAQEYIYTANHILDNAHTSSDQKLNLRKLNDAIKKGFNTTFEDFKKQTHHSDHWKISVEDLKNKKWKNASALVDSNRVLKYGFFKGKQIPGRSTTLEDGVKCITWNDLLENHPDFTYLDRPYKVRDYAKDRKKIILGLRDKNLKANTTKHFNLPDGTLIWAARTTIDNKDTIIFSTFSADNIFTKV